MEHVVQLHGGWIVAGCSVFTLMMGFVSACFVMGRVQSRICKTQVDTCKKDREHRVERYEREFARRETIAVDFLRIEQKVDRIEEQVNFIARSNGYRKGPNDGGGTERG